MDTWWIPTGSMTSIMALGPAACRPTWSAPGRVPLHASGVGSRRQQAAHGITPDRAQPAEGPRAGPHHTVATTAEGGDDLGAEAVLDDQAARVGETRVERRREAVRVPGGGVDGFLELHPGT